MVAYLQGLSVENVATNIYWHFHVNEGIFVHHVTRSGWWSLVSGSAKKSSRPCPTVISSSEYPKFCGDISYITANSSPISAVAAGNH